MVEGINHSVSINKEEGHSLLLFLDFFLSDICGLIDSCIVLGSLFFTKWKPRLAEEVYWKGGREG